MDQMDGGKAMIMTALRRWRSSDEANYHHCVEVRENNVGQERFILIYHLYDVMALGKKQKHYGHYDLEKREEREWKDKKGDKERKRKRKIEIDR